MPDTPREFLLVTCQIGAEGAVKHEIARDWLALRFAYSRPGFLTFKLPAGMPFADDFDLKSVFARAHAFSLGKAAGATPEERARSVWELLGIRPIEAVHVWPRDRHEPGFRDYEPGPNDASRGAERLIRDSQPASGGREPPEQSNSDSRSIPRSGCAQTSGNDFLSARTATNDVAMGPLAAAPPCPPLQRGGHELPLIADVVLVEDDEWWVGCHRAHSLPSSWPGGFLPATLPADAVSRVYLKMLEALLWSGFPLEAGQRCIEIGCAPGGASQVLLERGLSVVGIDPAEMPPAVLGHPRFRHIRRRSKEVRRREFVGADWLTCDINLPPNYTLDTVEAIVAYPGVRFRGMILALKLIDWSLAEHVPEYLERIRSWGFKNVRARQLHHNRQEICVVASSERER